VRNANLQPSSVTCELGLAVGFFQRCRGVGARGNGVPTPFALH